MSEDGLFSRLSETNVRKFLIRCFKYINIFIEINNTPYINIFIVIVHQNTPTTCRPLARGR